MKHIHTEPCEKPRTKLADKDFVCVSTKHWHLSTKAQKHRSDNRQFGHIYRKRSEL